jgi:twitching motility protein PilT
MAIMDLYGEGLIAEETAVLYCTNKGIVTRGIDKIKKTRGETTSTLSGISLDSGYGKKK